jgi:hypothetical protein
MLFLVVAVVVVTVDVDVVVWYFIFTGGMKPCVLCAQGFFFFCRRRRLALCSSLPGRGMDAWLVESFVVAVWLVEDRSRRGLWWCWVVRYIYYPTLRSSAHRSARRGTQGRNTEKERVLPFMYQTTTTNPQHAPRSVCPAKTKVEGR